MVVRFSLRLITVFLRCHRLQGKSDVIKEILRFIVILSAK